MALKTLKTSILWSILAAATAYTLSSNKINALRWRRTTRRAVDLSPFEEEVIRSADDQYPLTLDNVEMILDELRPYLMSDGGNVRVSGIEGPVVRLQLEGACGDCPSSATVWKSNFRRPTPSTRCCLRSYVCSLT